MTILKDILILSMVIIIAVLFWRLNTINTNFKVFKEKQELENKQIKLTIIENQKQSLINDLKLKSELSVKQSKEILSKINNEKPKIKTASNDVMFKFISTYNPE